MSPGVGLTQNDSFSVSKHTKQLLLVIFHDIPAGIEDSPLTQARTHDGRTEGQTDAEVEIVI